VTISILSPKSEAHWFGFDSLVSFSSLPIEGLKRDMFWFFSLVGFSFNASLEPQLRAQRRARLAEDALARNDLLTTSVTLPNMWRFDQRTRSLLQPKVWGM